MDTTKSENRDFSTLTFCLQDHDHDFFQESPLGEDVVALTLAVLAHLSKHEKLSRTQHCIKIAGMNLSGCALRNDV